MITAVVIDDEQNAIDVIKNLCKNFVSQEIKIIGEAYDLRSGIEVILKTKPDAIFLDIDMPNGYGINIYEYFPKPDFQVIFTTAHEEYALKALKNSAFDYLVKPISFIEFRETIDKLTTHFQKENEMKKLESTITNLVSSSFEGQSILFDTENGFVKENTNNIEYCKANGSYTSIITFGGREIVVSKSLKEIVSVLPHKQFYRTHKTYLVNINFINSFIKGKENFVELKSGTKIPVSVRASYTISKDIKGIIK